MEILQWLVESQIFARVMLCLITEIKANNSNRFIKQEFKKEVTSLERRLNSFITPSAGTPKELTEQLDNDMFENVSWIMEISRVLASIPPQDVEEVCQEIKTTINKYIDKKQ